MLKLDIGHLRNLLRYEPETGKLFWLSRPENMFPSYNAMRAWNGQHAGKEAFTANDGQGYHYGKIHSINYKAHRVIWALVYGEWPAEEIDHINGSSSDNRLVNLREATRVENCRNRTSGKRNKSGYRGVCFRPETGKWVATIKGDGKQIHLGCFNDPQEAHLAYSSASKRLHGEFSLTETSFKGAHMQGER